LAVVVPYGELERRVCVEQGARGKKAWCASGWWRGWRCERVKKRRWVRVWWGCHQSTKSRAGWHEEKEPAAAMDE
jgi:hypothetical protein